MSTLPGGKGARYLAQLDQALCNGRWAEVEELARKTDKHAPELRNFTLAARSEAQIARIPRSAPSTPSASQPELGELVTKLTAATASSVGDGYAVRVCLAHVYLLRSEHSSALEALSSDADNGEHGKDALGWREVCDVKAAFIKAVSVEELGNEDEAQRQYLQAAAKTPGSRSTELRTWTERLLARACIFMNRKTASPTLERLSDALRCFHAWSDFWQRSPPPSTNSGPSPSHLDVPRRHVWKAYYDLLSTILRRGIARPGQRADMKRAETMYESLQESQFPKASQHNSEIEQWVEQVVANWEILAGPLWTDHDLGEGGKESLGRGVLDILYRAATKTFHSTPILRHLFTVHAALGEFDLALHAFNSYVEIVSKGNARAVKTGKREAGFDSDDVAILTAVDAVNVLCRYGDFEQAEKALEVRKTIQSWLQMHEKQVATAAALQPSTFASAHRAIGISQAHWSRLTFETDVRPTLGADALSSLQRAQQYGEVSLETSYALALLLAESRDVSAATDVIRKAIAASQTPEDSEDAENAGDGFRQERKLVPLWHLLALCLTAKDDYEQAGKMCGAAFEQFGDAEALYGDSNNRLSVESEQPSMGSAGGLVDQMDAFEKEGLLQIKMTQVALLELTEGAEAAVGVSHELPALYARLFGNPERLKPATGPPQTATSAVPSKAGGTLRSLAGSIRPGSKRHSQEKTNYKHSSLVSLPEGRTPGQAARGGTANGVPIAITVTNEEGVATEKSHHHKLPFKLRGHHGDWREHGNLKWSRSVESIREEPVSTPEMKPPVPAKDPEKVTTEQNDSRAAAAQPAVDQNLAREDEKPLMEVRHNASPEALPAPAGHSDRPPRQDTRLPTQHPGSAAGRAVRLALAQDRKHKVSLVVEVWLFIAGLYLRADLLDDASGAIQEAHKFVDMFEVESTGENTNARRLFQEGWGSGKSIDHLWADVWAAKGELATAMEQPWLALEAYEESVAYFPDHANGIIGLSNILLDIYEEKLPVEEPHEPFRWSRNPPIPPQPPLISLPPPTMKSPNADAPKQRKHDPTPTEVNRLAARDRAYMLLNTLTRLGGGWDSSEAWFTLARAHELSGQIDKAKKALWWVVELEENKPIRPWGEVGPGSFTL